MVHTQANHDMEMTTLNSHGNDPPNSPVRTGAPADTTASSNNSNMSKTVLKIKGFSRIKEKKYFSEVFEVAGCKWKLLMFPRGNEVDQLSLYLDAVDASYKQWSRGARFTLRVVNSVSEKDSVTREATHRFTPDEHDWGFTNFMKLTLLNDPRGGFLKDDRLVIEVGVELVQTLPSGNAQSNWLSLNYDSKKETGFVGLKNQGATCYMNSLLQALYHIGTFRQSVYNLPTDNDVPTKSIPLALQRIFFRLQFGNESVATKELTKSFGWTAIDSFTQHDVQELNRVLCDNLQGKMKGTKAEGTIENLLQGKIRNFIKCVDIEYESKREEHFFDLSLNVKGCKDIYASFDKYVEVEQLDGDNKYHAEGHGLQAAKKGCNFVSFPPVLHLQLKRFEYDPSRDAMVKVNDKYDFEPEIDLTRYLSEDADKSTSAKFQLHGVLVHSGDVHGGHYYAFIRPTAKDEWFRFDDERVTTAPTEQVLKDNRGGEEEIKYVHGGQTMLSRHKKFSNAYMLVYLRDTEVDKLLANIPESDIPPHLKERFTREEADEEAKKKEKAEAHLYMTVRVVTDADLRASKRTTDLVKFDTVKEFKVRKASTVKELRKVVAEAFGVPPERQRYWNWVSRQNKTIRPDQPLTPAEEDRCIEDLSKSVDLKLYLEVSKVHATSENTVYFPPVTDDDVLLFLKHYDPVAELVQTVGSVIVRQSHKVHDLAPVMNNLAGYPPQTSLLIFEEVKPSMIDILKPGITLKDGEISNGDVLVFQKIPSLKDKFTIPTAPEFYDYIMNRITVKFRRLDQPRKLAFSLELSKRMTYDQVAQRLSAQTGTTPDKIRFTGHNSYNDSAKPQPIKRQDRMVLNDMLLTYYQPISDTLFFETLDIPVAELENKKVFKISWCNYKTDLLADSISVIVPRDATIADILKQLQALAVVKLDPENGSGKLRLLEIWTSKIHKEMDETDNVLKISEFAKLRAEEIPKDELSIPEGSKKIPVVHFHREYNSVQVHGNPFYVVVGKDETLASVKPRIQKRLGIVDEDFAKWKFAVITFSRPEYLSDSDSVIGNRTFNSSEYLGLEHQDTTPKVTNRYHFEKPIKIYG